MNFKIRQIWIPNINAYNSKMDKKYGPAAYSMRGIYFANKDIQM